MNTKKLKKQKKIRKLKIKKYKKQLRSDMFDLENELTLTEKGDAKIECEVGEVNNVFSRYDVAKNRTIKKEFYEFLMQEAEIIPQSRPLEIVLNVNNSTTPLEEKNIIKAIKSNFAFEITAINLKIKNNSIVSTLLYMGGILSFIVNALLTKFIEDFTLNEMLLIATWFFAWEGTNVAFFERSVLKQKRYDMLRIYNSNIVINKLPEAK